MSLSLIPRCQVCGTQENLLRCQGCKVVLYCSKEHQVADRPNHKRACNAVKKAQQAVDKEEKKLRDHPGDMFMPPNVFEEAVGVFWGIHETRPYMRARYGLVDGALLKIKTRDAVQTAHDHLMDMLRLCRGDNMGVRSQVPFLKLRLGRDQECYDFLKWWFTTGQESDYNWGDTDLPYLDIKDADIFEPVDLYTHRYANLAHSTAVTLIKIRMLLDLMLLQKSMIVSEKPPQELLDNVRGQLVSSVISKNKEIMDSKDQTPLIRKLEAQIRQLYTSVQSNNPHFWKALLQPGANLNGPPQPYSHGSPQEMQLVLQYSYASWAETEGAIDMIRELANKSRK